MRFYSSPENFIKHLFFYMVRFVKGIGRFIRALGSTLIHGGIICLVVYLIFYCIQNR